ncbi:DNA ligase (NAD(+)) LigA [Halobacteriales archaeon SW_8_65_20]|nr:MAG: DNA ligase (NAD(+)) LigA [Halobacteriales archaeon SW_8_65_20]
MTEQTDFSTFGDGPNDSHDAPADTAVPEDAPENPYIAPDELTFAPVEKLTEETARDQADALREAIRYHDHRYYVAADPVIGDRVYDALFDRLQALEAEFGLDASDSPTRRVGGEPVDSFDTVEHVAPMLSIDSSGEASDVREFADRVAREVGSQRFVCEPKFDGISIEVVYENGVYERAVTRGDGEAGDDVTRNVRTVASIPERLRGDHPEFLAVRGELYMPREAFTAYNRERTERGDDAFANPRNATAGTIRQQDPAVVAERPLDCFFFETLAGAAFDTAWERHTTLPEWGLPVNDEVRRVEGIDGAIDYRNELVERRDDLDYETDGTVIKVDDRAACERLGATARAPRWAYAYKFPARSEETTVRDIAVQVGRTGRLTPVALLDPIEVGGVMVSRASLHNPGQIAELGVGVGDAVELERAGDVIPYVDAVVETDDDGHYAFPDRCPVCDSAVERDGPLAFCTGGVACGAQLQRAIEHYASRDALDVEGLGEKSVAQLMEAGLVGSLPDLYTLDRDAVAELAGWGETSADNLLSAIEASRDPELGRFLVAIGVPEVGPTVARDLARAFGSFDAVRTASRAALESVDGIGEVVATEIREFFDSAQNERVIDGLLDHVDPQEVDVETGDALAGLTFVFTGSLSGMTRGDAQELVEQHGANATSSVSSNTDYLVAGDSPGQNKTDDAESNDVPVLDEAQFRELLTENGIEPEA